MNASRPQRLLVAIDHSPASAQALAVALSLSATLGAELHVAHVTPEAIPLALADDALAIPPAHNLFALMRRECESRLQQFVEANNSTGRALERHVYSGEPRQELLRAASELGADWLVVGSHGHSVIDRWLLGSVAEHLLRHSPIPVLLVRAGTGTPDAGEDNGATRKTGAVT